MPIRSYQRRQQQGAAALLVTVLIALIATVASVYTTRTAMAAQRSAINDYQQLIARTAAEEGAEQFIERVRQDLTILAGTVAGTPILLMNAPPPTSTGAGCNAGGSLVSTYQFIGPTYAAGTGGNTFAPNRYYAETVSNVEVMSGVSQGAQWRAQAKIDGAAMYIRSEGCVGQSCDTNDASRAVVRRTVKMVSSIAPGNNALTMRAHFDSNSTINISNGEPNKVSNPLACGMLYGSGGNPDSACNAASDPKACMSISTYPSITDAGSKSAKDATLAAMTGDAYFKSMTGGLSKSDVRAMSVEVSSCSGANAVGAAQKFIWFNGDPGACSMPAGKFIVVNGNISGTVSAQGSSFLYVAGDVYQNGAINVEGSAAVEGIWDIGPLGQNILGGNGTLYTNGMSDAVAGGWQAETVAAKGALTISYRKTTFKTPATGNSNVAGSWIDY